MTKPNVRKTRHLLLIGQLLNDLEEKLAADDDNLRDRIETEFIIRSFMITEQAIGFSNIPMSITMDICDVAGLKLTDYIEVEVPNEFPF